MTLHKDAVDSLRKRADDWPKLDFVLGNERHWGVFECDIERIEPAIVVADDYWTFYSSTLDILAIVFYFNSQVVHQLAVVVKIPNTEADHLIFKPTIFEQTHDESNSKCSSQEVGKEEKSKGEDCERADNNTPLVPLREICPDQPLHL